MLSTSLSAKELRREGGGGGGGALLMSIKS